MDWIKMNLYMHGDEEDDVTSKLSGKRRAGGKKTMKKMNF